jgi:SnoaL-like polyketide cyclase
VPTRIPRSAAPPLVENLELFRYAFPDMRVAVEDAIADGDRVVTRLRLEGTPKNRLMGIAASGRRVHIQGIRIDRLEAGKIAESWFHWDTLGMLAQIGAAPSLNRRPTPVQPLPQPRFTADLEVADLEPAMWNAPLR